MRISLEMMGLFRAGLEAWLVDGRGRDGSVGRMLHRIWMRWWCCCVVDGRDSESVSVNTETRKCNNVNDTVSSSIIVPPFLCDSYMRLEERAVMGINIPHSTFHTKCTPCLLFVYTGTVRNANNAYAFSPPH